MSWRGENLSVSGPGTVLRPSLMASRIVMTTMRVGHLQRCSTHPQRRPFAYRGATAPLAQPRHRVAGCAVTRSQHRHDTATCSARPPNAPVAGEGNRPYTGPTVALRAVSRLLNAICCAP